VRQFRLWPMRILLLPRLMAIAELVGRRWLRALAPPARPSDFAGRVAAQGARLQAGGLNFYTTAQVPWQLAGIGAGATLNSRGTSTERWHAYPRRVSHRATSRQA